VLIIDAKAGFPANIESINLTAVRKLRDITTTMDKLPSLSREFGADFLRVVVKSETKISGLSQQVCAVLPNALDIRQEAPGTLPRPRRPDLLSKLPPGAVKPVDLFARYVKEQKNGVASTEMLAKFEELYSEARYEAD
jgi:hypothetical protein